MQFTDWGMSLASRASWTYRTVPAFNLMLTLAISAREIQKCDFMEVKSFVPVAIDITSTSKID